MRAKIQLTTFRRDLSWVDFHLQTFAKFCTGFSGVTIVVPTVDLDLFLPFEQKYSRPDCPVYIKTFLEFPDKGFNHHMAMICYADIYNPDATHIVHPDPDCMWTKPTTPYDYIIDEKPVLLIEPFDAIMRAGHMGRYGWKKVVEDALRIDVTHETMCRHPAVHHKWLYKAVREHIEARHQIPFTDYVLRQQNAFPQGFAEYPTLGAIAVAFHAHKYTLIDRGYDGEMRDPEPHLVQMWAGHSEPAQEHNRLAIQKILG